MKTFLFLSNMFPSPEDPTFGVFVQRSLEDLASSFTLADYVVITTRRRSIKKSIYYAMAFVRITVLATLGRFDFIYAHYLTHTTWALIPFMARRRIIINVHGYDFIPTTRYQRVLSIFNCYILERARLVVVPSNYARDQLLVRYSGLKEADVFVNYSGGVDRGKFFPRHAVKSYDLVYVSRIDPEKGWRILLDAVVRIITDVPYLRVAFCGAGTEIADLQSMITNLGLSSNVDYIGAITPDLVPEWICKSRYFVFPTHFESLGLVSLEALTCGIPVITYDKSPMNDFVIDGVNGFLFYEYNEVELSRTLLKALNIPYSKYCDLCSNALSGTARFDRNLLSIELKDKLEKVTQ